MMHRRHGFQVVALRISNTAPMDAHLDRMARAETDPSFLARELWAYLDVRDGARAFALAVERDIPGCHVINVMAPDTYSGLPTAELMARYHPSTPLRRLSSVVKCRSTSRIAASSWASKPEHLLPLPR